MTDGSRPDPDPTLITTENMLREIAHLKELLNLRFELIERQRLESKEDSSIALGAALTTAKESVASLATAAELERGLLTKAVDELRDRITAVEAKALGASSTRAESIDQRADSNGRIALIVAGATFLVMVVNEVVVHIGH
jgi:hypothetical protein